MFQNLQILWFHLKIVTCQGLIQAAFDIGILILGTLIWEWPSLIPLFLIKCLFFHEMIALQNYESCFLFHLISSFGSRDIEIFVVFSLPLYTFQTQKDKWKWNNLRCHELACINWQIFGITQKLLYITLSNLVRQYMNNK